MIVPLTYQQVLPFWQIELWPHRSDIEPISWMKFPEGHQDNSSFTGDYWGVIVDGNIVGVNSGHKCLDGSYRSRGLWVHESQRGKGWGRQLLLATVDKAKEEQAYMIWSFPRFTSFSTYKACGFERASPWIESPSTTLNAYSILYL